MVCDLRKKGIVSFFSLILLSSTVLVGFQLNPAIAQTPPQFDTYVLNPQKDSFLSDGNSDQNEGANGIMRLKGQERPILSFNQTEIENAASGRSLVNATLRLNIEANTGNWGPSGDTVSIHRVLEDWAEGNAANVGGKIAGTGSGVTWNCAIDADISNKQTDCSLLWNGSNFDPTIIDSELILAQQEGIIEFDVSTEVGSFLNGTSENYGWILRKTNDDQSGRADFTTKESSSGIPELILVFAHVDPVILDLVNEVEEANETIDLLDTVNDEAILIDFVNKKVNDLKVKVDSFVTDPTVNQTLQGFLDSALAEAQLGSNEVLAGNETNARNHLSNIQSILSNFINEVQSQPDSIISQANKTELSNDAQDIINKSSFVDEETYQLLDENGQNPLLRQVIMNTQQELELIMLDFEQLSNMGAILEVIVEDESSQSASSEEQFQTLSAGSGIGKIIKILVKINSPAGQQILNAIKSLATGACGLVITESLLAETAGDIPPVSQELFDHYNNANNILCTGTVLSPNLDPYFDDQIINLYLAIGKFVSGEGDPSEVATAMNQPNIRSDLWFETMLFYNPGFPIEGQVQSLFDSIIDVISGTISGTVFFDWNQNQMLDATPDTPLLGYKVFLENERIPETIELTANSTGGFEFTNLASANYTLRPELVQGLVVNVPDPLTTGGLYQPTIVSKSDIRDLNFGYNGLSEIRGIKFDDQGVIGQKDPTDLGLEDWTITLTHTDTISGQQVNLQFVTIADLGGTQENEQGAYAFTGLPSGTFDICEINQTGWTQTYPTTLDGCHQVILNSNTTAIDVDFGNQLDQTGDPNLFENFDNGLVDWTQTSCNIQNSDQSCVIDVITTPTPVPSEPYWGYVAVNDIGGQFGCSGPVSVEYTKPYTAEQTGDHTITSSMVSSTCSGCTVSSKLLVDGSIVMQTTSTTATGGNAVVPLTAGSHDITLQMSSDQACNGQFRAQFDDITIIPPS